MENNPAGKDEVKTARKLLHTLSGLISAANYGLYCCRASQDRETLLSCAAETEGALNESAATVGELRAILHSLERLVE
jgi:hypothetical protein